MSSPARKHFESKIAALKVEQGSDKERAPAAATQYELMLMQLAEDKRRLSAVQSMEKRAELKIQLLPTYAAWVKGVIEGNQGVQDDVLMTVMVWCIDAGFLADALPIAKYAIEHGLKMPDQYKRTTSVVIAEEIADHFLRNHTAGAPLDFEIIATTIDITQQQDMPDEVRAKLYKVLGYAILSNPGLVPDRVKDESDRLNYALNSFTRALELHDKVGVKKDIESLERDIKNLANDQNK